MYQFTNLPTLFLRKLRIKNFSVRFRKQLETVTWSRYAKLAADIVSAVACCDIIRTTKYYGWNERAKPDMESKSAVVHPRIDDRYIRDAMCYANGYTHLWRRVRTGWEKRTLLNLEMVILNFNVGGQQYSTTATTLLQEKHSLFNEWFTGETAKPPLEKDGKGAFFIDRDPISFGVILNYLRLKSTKQLWEACLPKDPDRLALLTQEAEYYKLHQLREQAIALLQSCTEKSDVSYVNEVLAKSFSCPQGLDGRGSKK